MTRSRQAATCGPISELSTIITVLDTEATVRLGNAPAGRYPAGEG